MKQALRALFGFILRPFEAGDEPYQYKPLNRKILVVVGVLFSVLWIATAFVYANSGSYDFLLPVGIFFIASLVCLVVGLLGTDRAVARIWGNR